MSTTIPLSKPIELKNDKDEVVQTWTEVSFREETLDDLLDMLDAVGNGGLKAAVKLMASKLSGIPAVKFGQLTGADAGKVAAYILPLLNTVTGTGSISST